MPEGSAAPAMKSGITVGLNRGHKVHKLPPRSKPVSKKGRTSKHKELAKSIIRSVVGSTPYEKRIYELLRINKDKQAKRYAKKRLGSCKRGIRKCEDVSNLIAEKKRVGAVH